MTLIIRTFFFKKKKKKKKKTNSKRCRKKTQVHNPVIFKNEQLSFNTYFRKFCNNNVDHGYKTLVTSLLHVKLEITFRRNSLGFRVNSVHKNNVWDLLNVDTNSTPI